MLLRKLLIFLGPVFLSGCLYHAKERADQEVCDFASRPFDLAPESGSDKRMPPAENKSSAQPAQNSKSTKRSGTDSILATDVQTAAYLQEPPKPEKPPPTPDLRIPSEIPGSETPPIDFKNMTDEQRREAVKRLYPPLPELTQEPTPLPGPDGKPYALSDLQRLAAENSPTLHQAAADVQTAMGNVIQARTYPNPTAGYQADTVNDAATAGFQGFFWDQPIKTAGKLKLQTAAAEMDLRNAELALRRARSDLATSVRNAYFGVLVAKETVRVTKALARFTDQVYQIQANLNLGGFVAGYEPASLRSQAYTTRLAYKQALQTYIYAWKQLVVAIGERQLPLSEVAGRLDAAIPYYDFDEVLNHVLRNHTDVLSTRNTIDKARYNLKLAQITPFFQDMDVRALLQKDFTAAPFMVVHSVQIGMMLPVWNQNKGAIIAQEGTLARASQEPQRVELSLTNTFATAYLAYKHNLQALEYYRRHILPDQVRAYRGVYERRQVDLNVAFADLSTAQQNLAAGVTTYLTILGQLWTSVVTVADFMQTDDLYQIAKPKELPPLPDLDTLPPWGAQHDCSAQALGHGIGGKACTTSHPVNPPKAMPRVDDPPPSSPAPISSGPATAPVLKRVSRVPSRLQEKIRTMDAQPADDLLLEPPPKMPMPFPDGSRGME
jgi:cobalt-zinc-cadmium efflux system outer membrane protein